MLRTLGCDSLDHLMDQVVPEGIRSRSPLLLPDALTEEQALQSLRAIMGQNQIVRSFLGLGYHDTFTPPVLLRNLFENPGWYTAYTPYQAEISQGRLEALLNFQTLICDLTALDVANASLLDEGTACAEACALALNAKPNSNTIIVSDRLHAHVIDVLITRMEPLGVHVLKQDVLQFRHLPENPNIAAVVAAYPDTLGTLSDLTSVAGETHQSGALFIVTADLLALTVLKAPGEFGADICVGNSQRFGVPLGFGGPHAAFMAVRDPLKRRLPGRLIGVSHDAHGRPAFRLSLQTREQHIRREKATSNICTAQVLLAVMASMYAVYHGPEGLKAIARRTHSAAAWLAKHLTLAGLPPLSDAFFDTLSVDVPSSHPVILKALDNGLNLRAQSPTQVVIALDERVTPIELLNILAAFEIPIPADLPHLSESAPLTCPADLHRQSEILTHPVFHSHHSETAMMRYLRHLQDKDIALDRSMIPLGSCTMKLNAAAEMLPLSWPHVNALHPFAPASQTQGYRSFFTQLEAWLAECTGFHAVSLQPNAGSQGEYAGLLAIRAYHHAKGQGHRNICLIPTSAHGTNPASAVMVGFQVVAVACDDHGNIDLDDLRARLDQHAANLAALMVTYPSTHGVFEESIAEICRLTHEHGGQVYMDGANLNAQLGLTSPGRIGADVCHLNLHKTFCIPHGGGGPGVGPIGVAQHLAPFLPGHALLERGPTGAVCSAPWGSASILTISWMYLAMMGPDIVESTRFAILNANYIAKRLAPHFPTLYQGANGFVAHECILDLRHFKHITVEDVAKRLMDYGYHAPTMSWPVGGTLMIEPTESESKAELDRFCDAMTAIRAEIEATESGTADPKNNPLKNAPHTAHEVTATDWPHPYTRETAAFPLPYIRQAKYWPPVSRIDNVFGDRNLICSCPTVADLT
jgi:glycine dehydrogenase